MNLNDFKISTRLGVTFGIVTLLILILGIAAFDALARVSDEWDDFSKVSLRKRELATEGQVQLGNTIHYFKNFLLRDGDYDKKFLNGLAAINDAAAQYGAAGAISDREKESLGAVVKATAQYQAAMDKVREMKAAGTDVQTIDKSIQGADKAIADAFATLLKITMEDTRSTGSAITRLVSHGKQWVVGLNLIAVILAVACAWLVSRSITRPLNQALKIAQTVAAGDLTSRIEVTHRDETGQLLQALKEMNENLVRIVQQVQSGTDVINEASHSIASGNLDLSSRTEEQASSLEETASSIEELTGMARQNADSARQANELAASAADVAVRGGEVVSRVVETMSSINTSSKKIVDIIAVIDGIAFQTNILALNAAVEAARAGEQGRGFAVVATEVRSLAQRSATAAKEIKALINDSVQRVDAGAELVDQAGTTMNEIVASIKRVTDLMTEMAAASQEESSGIEQINRTICQIDEITQQNAALVEEVASASDSLQGQAANLSRVANLFKLGNAQTIGAPNGEGYAPAQVAAGAAASRTRRLRVALPA